MVASNGLEIAMLAQTAFEAYRHASGSHDAQWEALTESDKEAWEHVAGQAILQLDREDLDIVSSKMLASDMHEAYIRGLDTQPKPFDDLTLEEQLCWEAAGRHLFNLIDSDGSVKPSEHEPRWRAWAENQLQRRQK
jgi:hypothetical protein